MAANPSASPLTTSAALGLWAASSVAGNNGVTLGCVNAWSVGNKAAMLCHIITDEHLGIFAVSETWHECSESTVLKRITSLGYNCIDAARLIPPQVCRESIKFQNHSGLVSMSSSPDVPWNMLLLCLTLLRSDTFVWRHSVWLIKSSYSVCQRIQHIRGVLLRCTIWIYDWYWQSKGITTAAASWLMSQ